MGLADLYIHTIHSYDGTISVPVVLARARQIKLNVIASETYNARLIDKMSNDYAHILAKRLDIAQTASSDAHVVEAIGLGATKFDGCTAQDLIRALQKRETRQRRQKEWNSVRILESWAANYISSAFTRLAQAGQPGV